MGLEPDRTTPGRGPGSRVVVATLLALLLLVGGAVGVVLTVTGDDGDTSAGPSAPASSGPATTGASDSGTPSADTSDDSSDDSSGPGDGRPDPEERALLRVKAALAAARHGDAVPRRLRPSLDRIGDDRVGTAEIGGCDYRDPIRQLCPEGALDATRTLVLLGNSHALHWVGAINELATRAGYRAYFLVKSQCSAVVAVSVAKGETEPWEDCNSFNDWAREQVRELEPDLVIVSTTPPLRMMIDGVATGKNDPIEALMPQAFGDLVDLLAPLSDRVALIGDIPRRVDEAAPCLRALQATLFDCVSDQVVRTKRLRNATGRVATDRGATFVDPQPWFCSKGRCPAVIGTTVPMRDQGHMTATFSRQLAPALAAALGIPLDEG